ncbi:MAG TPA: ester cyclase [Jiangellaceae bacterium]|nr:ester cyclase [Jiangellaceae bacterium]
MTPDRTPATVAVVETNKRVVRRLVEVVMNERRLEVIDELYHPRLAQGARRWIEPFLASFSDVHMRIDDLIAEDETVVGRFSCSGTHTGDWLGHPPTGRRFTDVAEVYIFRIADGRIVGAWGLEDTLSRLRQLGLEL